MEFLITYGWAILAAIIAIGVLGIFFSPRLLNPQTCIISATPYIYCRATEQGANAFGLESSGVAIEIENKGPNTINLGDAQIVTKSGISCSIGAVTQTSVPPGGTAIGINVCNSPLTEGDVFDADVTITHTVSDSQLERIATGTISGRVRDRISIVNPGGGPPPGGIWQGDSLQGGGGGGDED